jgi:hypothetical protein
VRTGKRRGRSASTRFWPFEPRLTMLIVILVLVILLAAWGLLREVLHFDRVEAGWVLLGIFALTVLPIVLLLLEGIGATGGSVEVGQIKVALTEAAGAQTLVLAPPNVTPNPVIGDSGSKEIIEGLRRARTSKIVVVSLEDGHAWWESRLLILCAGAMRLGQPQVIVFTATCQKKVNQFVGWGHPNSIRDRLLDANTDFVAAHDTATGLAAAARQMHALGTDITQNPELCNKQFILYPGAPGRLNTFLEEQLLAHALAPGENETHREIGLNRLKDLFDPVLSSGYVDRTDPDAEWFRKALRSDEEYLAITDSGTYVGLMTRAEVVTEVLLALASAKDGRLPSMGT